MSFSYLLAAAAFISLPLDAAAQTTKLQPDPSQANASVPEASYSSAFERYQVAADEQGTPDKTWRAANNEVEKLRGHAGHIDAASTAPASPAPTTPAEHGKQH